MSQMGKSVALICDGDGMGKLVQFENRGKAASAVKPDRAGQAEILIFTGVRYERQNGNSPDKPSASSGGKRKRG
jgi:hypothetical protein